MKQKPTILNRQQVAKTRLFNTEAVDLRFENQQERTFECINSNGQGAVLVIPQLDDKTFLLIEEYSLGVDNYQLGFPKGVIDPGEDCLQAANRELMEEAGYGANYLEKVKTLAIAPGHMSMEIDVVFAHDLYEKRLLGDEPEPLGVVPWLIADIPKLVESDRFLDARSVAALLMFYSGLIHAKS